MKRMLLAAAIAVSGAASATAAGATAPPRAALEAFSCRTASNQFNRWMSVTAVMRPVAGTDRMWLKFRLLRKTPGSGSFVNVAGGDLGKWRDPPDPTLGQSPNDVWKKTKQVIDLAAPAIYRFRVAFRWTGADGQVLSSTALFSRTCDQS